MTSTPSPRSHRWLPLLVWLGLALGIALVLVLIDWEQRVPAPRGPDAPAAVFSEARALETVRMLADEIGPHPIGSPEAALAAERLVEGLSAMPRVEVTVQEVEGEKSIALFPLAAIRYRVRNVIARLPGRRPEAVLIGGHYDSPPEAPGASDNGSGAAAVVETLRALSAGPRLEHTVIALLDGGEEVGLTGAHGFLKHPWARDVRVFLDVESLGAGRAAPIIASTDRPGLIEAYARAAPSPLANVFFADVANSGVLLFAGNFEPYLEADLPGLELAAFGNPWLIHTRRDTSAQLAPGSLQHLGDTLLSVSRDLAAKPLALERGTRHVYFDVLGTFVVTYGAPTQQLLGGAALALLAGLIVVLARRRVVAARSLVFGLGWTLLALLGALLAALAAAAILALVLGRPHGWFATPWLVMPAFAAPALATAAAVHALWRRRALRRGASHEEAAVRSWVAGVVLWGLLLLLGMATGAAGLSLVSLAWVAPSCLALLAAVFWPRARWPLWVVAMTVGALFSLPLAWQLVPTLAGMAGGMLGVPLPQDFTIAVVVWLFGVAPLIGCLFAVGHRVGGLGRTALALGLVALAGIAATATRAPYRWDRPKRLLVAHAEIADRSNVFLASYDVVPMTRIVAAMPGARPVKPGTPLPTNMGMPVSYRYQLPAQPSGMAPPDLEVLERGAIQPDGTRALRLKLHARGWGASMTLPRGAIAGWSLGKMPPPAVRGDTMIIVFAAPSAELGETFEVTLRGSEPVRVTLQQTQDPGRTPELAEVARRLPEWTTARMQSVQVVEIDL